MVILLVRACTHCDEQFSVSNNFPWWEEEYVRAFIKFLIWYLLPRHELLKIVSTVSQAGPCICMLSPFSPPHQHLSFFLRFHFFSSCKSTRQFPPKGTLGIVSGRFTGPIIGTISLLGCPLVSAYTWILTLLSHQRWRWTDSVGFVTFHCSQG
jgi:hypothetical protein